MYVFLVICLHVSQWLEIPMSIHPGFSTKWSNFLIILWWWTLTFLAWNFASQLYRCLPWIIDFWADWVSRPQFCHFSRLDLATLSSDCFFMAYYFRAHNFKQLRLLVTVLFCDRFHSTKSTQKINWKGKTDLAFRTKLPITCTIKADIGAMTITLF